MSIIIKKKKLLELITQTNTDTIIEPVIKYLDTPVPVKEKVYPNAEQTAGIYAKLIEADKMLGDIDIPKSYITKSHNLNMEYIEAFTAFAHPTAKAYYEVWHKLFMKNTSILPLYATIMHKGLLTEYKHQVQEMLENIM